MLIMAIIIICLAACFREFIDTREIQEENEEGEDKPKSIFDREDVYKDPLEDKDWNFTQYINIHPFTYLNAYNNNIIHTHNF